MPIQIRALAATTVIIAGLAATGCASDDEPAFPADYKATYTKMAACTKSSSHTEGPYVESWINATGLDAWKARLTLPAGSVLVKAQHSDAACASLLKYTAMRKDGSAWTWQQVEGDRTVANSGDIGVCTSCHTPCKANDWVCTAPK